MSIRLGKKRNSFHKPHITEELGIHLMDGRLTLYLWTRLFHIFLPGLVRPVGQACFDISEVCLGLTVLGSRSTELFHHYLSTNEGHNFLWVWLFRKRVSHFHVKMFLSFPIIWSYLISVHSDSRNTRYHPNCPALCSENLTQKKRRK